MFSVLSSSNNEIMSGGVYKIEGSIIVTIININFMIFSANVAKSGLATRRYSNVKCR